MMQLRSALARARVAALLLALALPALLPAQTVTLTDSAGAAQPVFFFTAPGNFVYVTVDDPSQAASPSVTAAVYSRIPPATNYDRQDLTLTRISPAGIFRNAAGLQTLFSATAVINNLRLEGKVNDLVVASYRSLLYQSVLDKQPTASTLRLVDAADADKNFFTIGTDTVWIRVTDDDENRDPAVADTLTVNLVTSNGDTETRTLTETGNSTGIFRGSIALNSAAVVAGNGTLQGAGGAQITATYNDPQGSDTSTDQANCILPSTSQTYVTDVSGTEQALFRIGTQGVYVTVYDQDKNTDFSTQQQVTATLTDSLTGDTLTVTLFETTNNSGIFRNASPGVTSAIGTATADALLQTSDGATVTARYVDPANPADVSTDTSVMRVTVVASQTRFTDNLGTDVFNYTIGVNGIYVTVNDADRNTSTASQSITVVVSSSITNDNQTLTLAETGGNTGVFRNATALPMTKNITRTLANGNLEAWPGAVLTATYTDTANPPDVTSDTATAQYFTNATVNVTNDLGTVPAPDQFRISLDPIYVTVNDDDENQNASVSETVTVTLSVASTSDLEAGIVLTETGANTGVFRNAGGLFSLINTMTAGDGLIETTDGATLQARYIDDDNAADNRVDTTTLVANQTASIITFTNAGATTVTSYTIGAELIWVSLDDPDENGDATTLQTVTVTLSSFATGDVESLTLTETGLNTGLFRTLSGVPTAISTRADNNGTLAVGDSSLIAAQYVDNDTPGDNSNTMATVRVQQTSSTCELTDSTGVLRFQVPIGQALYVTVTDQDENTTAIALQSVSVTVRNDTNGDTQNLTLTETANNAGIFRNLTGLATSLQSGAVTTGDGVIEANDGDTITVTYRDNDTPADLSFGFGVFQYLTNATVKFTDSTGGPVINQYSIGDIALTSAPIYIQVTDLDENHDPLVQEILYVNLSELRAGGDRFFWANYPAQPPLGNPIELTETTSSSGIFRSTTGLESELELVDTLDDVLQTIDGAQIQAVYTDPTDPTDTRQSNVATMRVLQQGSVIYFADSQGLPLAGLTYDIGTTVLADQVYLVVEDADEDTDPTIVNSVQAYVQSTATGDSDVFTLTEVDPVALPAVVPDPHTGFFIAGPIASSTLFRQQNNGRLEVAYYGWIRLHYQDNDDVADYGDDWAQMVPLDDYVSLTQFTDAAGTDVTTYVIGVDTLYVTLTDLDQNTNGSILDTVICTLTCADTGDVIANVALRETTTASGIFRNLTGVSTQLWATGVLDTLLQVHNLSIITVTYTDPTTATDTSLDTAQVVIPPATSLTRFTDVTGVVRTTFTIGAADMYVTVWDSDENDDPGSIESVSVTITSTYTGDVETYVLDETAVSSGIFRNTTGIPTDVDLPNPGDGLLQISHLETIQARYQDATDATDVSTHAAVVSLPNSFVTSFVFIDSAPGGAETTEYYIDHDLIYIRLTDTNRNRSALTTDTVLVNLTDPVNGDTVSVTLYEITSNSATFENWVTGVPSAVATPITTNFRLETFDLAVVRIDYVDPDDAADTAESTATMHVWEDSSVIAFTDQAGTTVTSFPIDPLRPPSLGNGALVYVTVWDKDQDRFASVAETLVVTVVSAATSDVLTNVLLRETGPNTGIFRNTVGINSQIATSNPADAILQTADGDTITVTYVDPTDAADVQTDTADMYVRELGGLVWFSDATGISRTSYYINADLLYVTVRDPDQNGNATVIETLAVDLVTNVNGDHEILVLSELNANSDTFRNVIGLSSSFNMPTLLDGVLQAIGGETVTVTYEDPSNPADQGTDTATMLRLPTVSQTHFIVLPGSVPGTVATSHVIRVDQLYVEVSDPDENLDPNALDSVQVVLTDNAPVPNDREVLTLWETGVNTGWFQSLLADGLGSDIAYPNQLDGLFQTIYPSNLTATYVDDNYLTDQSTHTIPTRMFQTTASIYFSDVAGTAVTTYGIALDLVYVTLTDESRDRNWSVQDSVAVTIFETATGDVLNLTLLETSTNTGVFRNLITTVPSQVALGDTTNGVIDTGDGHEILVLYQDPDDPTDVTSDTADMVISPTTSTVRFTDFFRNTVTWYTIQWNNVYVEVTDPDKNLDASVQETLVVTVYDNDTVDIETLDCTETTSSSGVFRSTTLPTVAAAGLPEDGILQTHDQSLILARYVDAVWPLDVCTATARMFIASSNSTIEFVDDLWLPALVYHLDADDVYVRVTDIDENTNPLTQQGVTVTLTCTASGDVENLVLPEDGVDSPEFVNTLGLPTANRATGTQGNGVLEGLNGYVVQAYYLDNDNPPSQPLLDQCFTTAVLRLPQTTAGVIFCDALGNPSASYLVDRSNIYVQVTDPDQNLRTTALDTVTVTIDTGTPNFDQLSSLVLTEVGLSAGVFRLTTALNSVIALAAVTTDRILQVREEALGLGIDTIDVTYVDPDDGTDVSASSADVTYFTSSVVAFTNSAGTTVSTYVIGVTPIFVTLWDMDRNVNRSLRETAIVTITADATGDLEQVTLTETGVDTGIFRNLTARTSVYAQAITSYNNLIQTIAAAVYPPEYTLTVDYQDPFHPADTSSDDVDVIPRDRNDRDGDGMPNWFEDLYPGVLDPDDPADAGQDFDGDGRSNLLEYLQGTTITDPTDNLPLADPGASATLDPSLIELDGSGSYDRSTHPPTGIVSYLWTVLAQPPGFARFPAVLSDATAEAPRWVGRVQGDYDFSLRVRDRDGAENEGFVTITVNDVAPMAEVIAGATVDFAPGATLALEGRGSSEANFDPMTFNWSWAGPLVVTNPTSRTPLFSLPAAAGVYTFQLLVNDPALNFSDQVVEQVIVHNPAVSWHVPTADAGADQTVTVGSLVTLDGTRSSDYDEPTTPVLTFAWTQDPTDLVMVGLAGAASAQPTFTPPATGIYHFRLNVSDSFLTVSAPDTVTIVANAGANHMPTANAGADGYGTVLVPYTLDGRASSDPDPGALTYQWTQVRGDRTPLTDPTTSTPSMTPITPGVYEWELVVSDGVNLSQPDRVYVTVNGAVNNVPVANAGLDQTVLLGTLPQVAFQLNGSASFDADGNPLTYYWRQLEGTSSSLSNHRTVNPTMTARVPGIYEFELVVYDGKNFSRPDRVRVTVVGTNLPPVANAGPDASYLLDRITGLATIVLNGSGSYDPDHLPNPVLTYQWRLTSGPSVTLSATNVPQPNFVASTPGDYTFTLRVDDGQLFAEDTVVIHVAATGNTVPIAEAGPDQLGVYIDTLVTLDGSLSYDPDADPFNILWTQISGPASLVLSSRFVSRPTFVPRIKGVYTFRLEVSGDDGSSSDTVNVYVLGGVAGDGGGTGGVDLGGATGGGGGGGCSAAPADSPNAHPAALLWLMLPLAFVALRRPAALAVALARRRRR